MFSSLQKQKNMSLNIVKIITLIIFVCCLTNCTSTSPTSNSTVSSSSKSTITTQSQTHTHHKNVIKLLSSQYHLPNENSFNPVVRKQIDWYMHRSEYLIRGIERSRPYLYYIYQEVKKRNLPAELALLPMVESNYDPFAYSRVGAAGLWQMMPGTASGFGLKVNWWYDGRRDVIASTKSALDYLEYLGKFFNGNWLLAIAAYDTGEGTVVAAMEQNIKHGKPTDFWHLPLPLETQRYIPKLLALATIMKYSFRYPIKWPFIPDTPHFVKVNIGSQIDLAHAAKMANISLKELSKLNPGFNRWVTKPTGPHHLLLPIDKVSHFEEELSRLPKEQRVAWTRYPVKKGDTLFSIAQQFKITITSLKKTNHLKSDTLHPKQILLIPTDTVESVHIASHVKPHYLDAISRKVPVVHTTNHTVKKGDTVSSVAKQYQVKTREIRFWNGLDQKKKLQVGQTLVVWPSKKYVKASNIPTTKYTIHKGDTLTQIAHHHSTSIKKLRQINHLKNDLLVPGRTLLVPKNTTKKKTTKVTTKKTGEKVKKLANKKAIKTNKTNKTTKTNQPKQVTHYVKSGENLAIIAKKYKVTIKDLQRWNQITDVNHLKVKQTLVLYV